MRSKYLQLLNDTRHQISTYVNSDAPDNVVLVESASTAVNALLRSMSWNPGDVIVYFATAYMMTQNTAHWLAQQYGIEIVEVPVQFPITKDVSDEAFLGPMERALQKLQEESKLDKLKVVVLDHIVSNPAVKQPILELSAVIKSSVPDSFVLVDGAHAMGQVRHLDLQALGPHIDAYLSNGHKWLYSPKGSAFLWIRNSQVSQFFPEPTVISSKNSVDATITTSLADRFSYVSTRDYTATLSMSKALDFREWIGGQDAIYTYVRTLALEAKHHLMDLWKVQAMVPDSMEEFMINILLPTQNATVAKGLQEFLLEQHNMYIIVAHDKGSDLIFTRLSAQIYLELSDFEQLGGLVLEFLDNHKNGMTEELMSPEDTASTQQC
jgi:selenocysteine lyase/cysteine desulfurase